MPVLVSNDDPNRIFEWSCNTFVGRRLIGGLSFDLGTSTDREVSSVHAALTWNRKEEAWQVHDLGSANGTIVGGDRLKRGEHRLLVPGIKVSFGSTSWTLRESAPPPLAATCGRGELRLATDNVLLLPDESHPEIIVVPHGDGWRQHPWTEDEFDPQTPGADVNNGDTLEVGGRTWIIAIPPRLDVPRTERSPGLASTRRLVLEVPANRERIGASLVDENGLATRFPARRHHELWWLLARARLADRDAGRLDNEGWITSGSLLRQLGVGSSQSYLNVLVFRSREQLRKAGFLDYNAIIERRALNTPEVRIGLSAVEICEI